MIVANPLSTEVKTNSQGFFYSEIIYYCYFGFDLTKTITAEFNSFEEQTNTCTQHWGKEFVDGDADEATNLI